MAENGRKGLTLKIAAGVFIGVMTALIVYHIPGWYKQHAAERAEEKQEEIDSRLDEMKPMEFVARCGSLLEDKTDVGGGSAAREVTVEVTMRDGIKKRAAAEWFALDAPKTYDPSSWMLDSVDGMDVSKDTWKRQIEWEYPCTVKPPENGSYDLDFLTPKEIISDCGKPVQDKSKDDGTTVTRYLMFEIAAPDGGKKKVTAVFSGGDATNLNLDYFGGLTVGSDSDAVEKWYPCLKPPDAEAP